MACEGLPGTGFSCGRCDYLHLAFGGPGQASITRHPCHKLEHSSLGWLLTLIYRCRSLFWLLRYFQCEERKNWHWRFAICRPSMNASCWSRGSSCCHWPVWFPHCPVKTCDLPSCALTCRWDSKALRFSLYICFHNWFSSDFLCCAALPFGQRDAAGARCCWLPSCRFTGNEDVRQKGEEPCLTSVFLSEHSPKCMFTLTEQSASWCCALLCSVIFLALTQCSSMLQSKSWCKSFLMVSLLRAVRSSSCHLILSWTFILWVKIW